MGDREGRRLIDPFGWASLRPPTSEPRGPRPSSAAARSPGDGIKPAQWHATRLAQLLTPTGGVRRVFAEEISRLHRARAVQTLLNAETAAASETLREAIAATLRAVTKLGGNVELVSPGALPNDGKVIADER